MKKLAIYGAGGFGTEAVEIYRRCNIANRKYEDAFFVVDNPKSPVINGVRVVDFQELAKRSSSVDVEVAICVGEPRARGLLAEKVRSYGFALATLIHPEVEVPESATIGEGAIVYRYSNIGPNARIGANTALLLGANAPHDNVIGENCVLSTNVTLSGNCTVGDNAYIAAGAVVKEGVSIGPWAIVGLGSVVFKDVAEEAITIGNPAKAVGRNDTHSVFSR